MDYILEEMNRCGADGVDFVPVISFGDVSQIYCSYTKEEWMSGNKYYPKSGRKYWKIVNGRKVYCDRK